MTQWSTTVADAPKDRKILVKNGEDGEPFITSWIDDVYTVQGGSGGQAGWFSGRYSDRWGDSPIMDTFTHWMDLPQ